ncbi:MAG: C40 family peptidase [Chitinophagaceae bacterium]
MSPKVSSYLCYFAIAGCLTSCSALRSSSSSNTASRQSTPRFINGIEITPGMSMTQIRHLEKESKRNEQIETKEHMLNTAALGTTNATALQAKYCTILDVPVETISNDENILQEVDEWWGTPYRLGGTSKSGIDCSAFCQVFLQDIYATSIPRTAQQQYDNCVHPDTGQPLQKGDLVFFGSGKHNITHVGVYLTNNKFVHASTSRGVMISDLNDTYWSPRYVGSGRYTSASTTSN